jgi:2-polyprenyl-6-methoxyphenol hydroxylase-like FAD-dependent oxidoreductase
MTRIVVVGAGLAGLAASLFMARRGHDILLLEQDSNELDPSDPSFPAAGRHGVPQARQSHMFLGRGLEVLRHHALDVATELVRTATTVDFRNRFPGGELTPEPNDERLVALGCRRVTFESVLRRAVAEEEGIQIVSGNHVDGLDAAETKGGTWRVDGVLAGHEKIQADLVIDATGATAGGKRWLAAIGVKPVFQWRRPARFLYITQWFRLVGGQSFPDQRCLPYAEGRFATVATFPGDDGYFSLTYMTPNVEPLLGALRDPTILGEVFQTFDLTRPWIDPRRARSIGPVIATSAGFDQRSSIQSSDDVRVTGFVAIGEAAMRTNPTRGRGTALTLLHAQLVADAVGSYLPDGPDLVSTVAERTERDLTPWFDSTVALDRDRYKRLVAGLTDGGTNESVPLELSFTLHALRDPVLYRAIVQTLNMYKLPGEIFADPSVRTRLALLADTTPADLDALYQGPTRAEFERIIKR